MVALALLGALLGGAGGRCGPTRLQAGTAVLAALPLIVALAVGLLYPIFALWRRRYPTMRSDRRLIWLVGGCGGLGLIALGVGELTLEWGSMALWIAGTSYLTLVLVAARVTFALAEHAAFGALVHGAVAALFAVPALGCLAGIDGASAGMFVWLYPGFGGWICGPLWLLLLLEAAIRGRAGEVQGPGRAARRRKRDAG